MRWIALDIYPLSKWESNWDEICPEKYYKKGSQSNRGTLVEMFRFYLQWSKVIQYAANSNEENGKHKYLQNYEKRLGMGKHPIILLSHHNLFHTFSLSIDVLYIISL